LFQFLLGGCCGDATFYVLLDTIGDELLGVLKEGVEGYVANGDCLCRIWI
jgi:hypothetical protein